MTFDTLPVLCAIAGFGIGMIPVIKQGTAPRVALPAVESDGSVLPAMNFEYNEILGFNTKDVVAVGIGVTKGYIAVMCARFLAIWLGAPVYPTLAIAAVFVVLGDCFPLVWRTAHRRGISVAAGAALGMNILPIILFCLMFLTGYFVIRRAKAVGAIAGSLGAVVLVLAAPKNLLYLTSTVPNTDIAKLKMVSAVIALAIFVRHIQPIQAVFRRSTSEHDNEPSSFT